MDAIPWPRLDLAKTGLPNLKVVHVAIRIVAPAIIVRLSKFVRFVARFIELHECTSFNAVQC